jgi:chemotaxis protein histidine kinase CheA
MKKVQNDIDQELLPLFMEEADELCPQIRDTMQAWHKHPADALLARKLQRKLHTLKGSARMAGAMQAGEWVHRMEEQVSSTGKDHSPQFRDALQSQFLLICNMIEQLRLDVVVTENIPHSPAENTEHRVPFSCIEKRLYRIVRQTGKELGKKANLELSGTDIELERKVLEKLTAPFEHLLRNAIAHGLEDPQQRELAGKPPIGDIRLSLRQENNKAVFEFIDDGAGLNINALRSKAVAMGLLPEEKPGSDDQVMQLIFAPGLTTAREVTAISGRGVGMDVVRSEITALGGLIDVSSTWGEGTRFIIHLPLNNF